MTEQYIELAVLAFSQIQAGELDKAVFNLKKSISLNTEYATAYLNLGGIFQTQGRYAEAVSAYLQFLMLEPDINKFYNVFNNLGFAYENLKEFDKAAVFYEKALQYEPDNHGYNFNLAFALDRAGKYREACKYYFKSISLMPGYPYAHWNLARLSLLLGDFSTGWNEYEWRFLIEGGPKIIANRPRWQGEDLTGKKILVKHEQGYGDSIQFSRYLQILQTKGGKIIFECPASLTSLYRSLAGYNLLVETNQMEKTLSAYDFYIPLLSLPLIFETRISSIPCSVPYLEADSELNKKWQKKLVETKGPKIGILWEGNPQNKNNLNRSCPPDYFYRLAQELNLNFFSLQKNYSLSFPLSRTIHDLSGDISDFNDTAAIINNLDLLISVDTSVVHLAGAMGKPVWTLLNYWADWRWLLDRNDSPWYPSMRLFRQPEPGNWTAVFKELYSELGEFVISSY